jgi:hypothetical protein
MPLTDRRAVTRRIGSRIVLATMLAGALIPFAGLAPAAQAAPASGAFDAVPAAQAAAPARLDARPTTVRSDNGTVLPATTYRRADGSTETVVDRRALAELVATMAAIYPPCGYSCDGKDPNSYWVPAPPGYEYKCATDAVTMASVTIGSGTAELRYSPTCRTAWTRGCCYTKYAGFGYYSNGSYRTAVYADGRTTGAKIWSAMLNDANLLYEACFDRQFGGPPIWVCSTRFRG